ncbi:MAG TPA: alpha/beta hydrolase domain-containing protein [Solirubrobacteraceae bacterium]|nr:alpha/beta hydrolase domain-containing protein [Solirubrobacteraceae bacterium]
MSLISRLLRLICVALFLLSISPARAHAPVLRVSGSLSASRGTATDGGLVLDSPTVTGPLPAVRAGDPSRNYPFDASLVPVSEYGYTEKEYFFSGDTSVGSYTSRMLVRRPTDPADFSGTAIVEWANDAQKFDLDLLWAESAADIMRSGDAFVLVSAQTEGVYAPNTALKAWNPQRYAPLSMPRVGSDVEEPASFQIFGQALEAIRSGASGAPLGGLQTERLIATGGSESAVTMTTYASQYGPRYGGVDGYLIWDLSTASLGDSPPKAETIPSPTTTAGPPVLWINTESDAARTRTTPDGPEYRLWELAGASHVDFDLWEYNAAIERRDFGSWPALPTCTYRPFSRIQTGYALDAGIADLTTWIKTNTPPPSQPPLQYDGQGNVVRDSYGNALGGVRLPDEAVPTAASGGQNSGAGCSGYSIPFTAEVLRDLYPTHADYVAKVKWAAEAAVEADVMVPYDAQQAVDAAAAADIPPGVATGHSAKSCAARRAVSIRIPPTFRRRRVLRARITTAGHRAIITHGGRRVRLVLRRRTGDKVRVRIALRLHGGKRVVQVRAYRMCRR